MADRGAKCLILLSRSGQKTSAAKALVESLASQGVRVETPQCDITDPEVLRAALEICPKSGMPAVKGCIQAAMQLQDSLFDNMTFRQWKVCVQPKIQGSWNLHATLPPAMDFFIMLSSISGIIGNIGQSNYAAGNTFEDALAHYRVSLGEKATSIDLGAVSNVGVMAEDRALPGWVIQLGGDQKDASTTSADSSTVNYAAQFAAITSLAEAAALVSDALASKLGRALSMPVTDIDTSKTLPVYGVDSLLAIELRNWFAKEMKADLAIFDIMNAKSIVAVSETAVGRSQYKMDEWDD
ncbi:MAG: hypothetical protein LQ340_001881 [Diploschistes diacapsis]|nr:MAG: hypothetical protein LQ340_001881 [Diploschistes diacapsis]